MSDDSKPVLECRSVWKIFGGSAGEAEMVRLARETGIDRTEMLRSHKAVMAVADVSLSVACGEVFCVMGLSGSGKSTLIRHMNCLVRPSAGQILINGRDIAAMDRIELTRLRSHTVAMVFQNAALLPHRTVRQNVGLSLELRGEPIAVRNRIVDEQLERVSLGSWKDKFPDELSGGMRQRVGLARALACDPQVLLMDEPFSALDPITRRQLQDEFRTLCVEANKTTIFITHDLDEAIRVGDRIAIMKDGRIVQSGTPEVVLEHPADAYVANFVRSTSRLDVIKLDTILEPIDPTFSPPANAKRADVGTPIGDIFDLAIRSDEPVLIENGEQIIGRVSKDGLLRTVRTRL